MSSLPRTNPRHFGGNLNVRDGLQEQHYSPTKAGVERLNYLDCQKSHPSRAESGIEATRERTVSSLYSASRNVLKPLLRVSTHFRIPVFLGGH